MVRKTLVCAAVTLAFCLQGAAPGEDAAASREPPGEAARRAVERYLSELDEIDRVAAKRRADARARLQSALRNAGRSETDQERYRGMLGSYFNADGRVPFVLLSVPDGENVYGDYARNVFNGRHDSSKPLHRFRARGHVSIPNDGTWRLEASRGHEDVKLNDAGYSLGTPIPGNRYCAEVRLAKGVYSIDFSVGNNGGQLAEGFFRIVDQASGQELPIFIYESEMKEFLDDLSLGEELIEISKWTPAGARLK